ncbi:MAG: glycosyltransferase [Ignavibacteria bacterium]|nr:glycosyltransferase [Ignavibacteria bacterium]MCU7502557.1 glycosyltransferase [Ignavibacteria bacterium]MCU7515240.1 glycosyltransferase [Ignavibacteria bacterium]
MKVVHICAADAGGAGKAAYRLHKGLTSLGIDSCLLVADKTSGDESVKVIPEDSLSVPQYSPSPRSYGSQKMRRQWTKWFADLSRYPGRAPGLEIFTDVSSVDASYDMLQEIMEADIINFHWMAGLLNFSKISSQFKNKNIVWTLHDMNPFTGGCHYTEGCTGFHHECGKCPQLASVNPEDNSRENWKLKLDAYRKMNIRYVTPSSWLRDEALKSSLIGDSRISVIANCFPMDIFRNYDKMKLRQQTGIPLNSKVILFGVDSLTTRKGFDYLLKALHLLSGRIKDNVILLTFGNIPEGIKLPEVFQVMNVGRITDEKVLAGVYNIADVLVIPSLEDNLPNVVPESLACGTPVVGFKTGGIPDMIEHKKNGYLAERKDFAGLAEGLQWVLFEADPESLRKESLRIAKERFRAEAQAQKYKMLYEQILEEEVLKGKAIPASKGIHNEVRVSAIVSIYNSEKFIRGCLDDLLGQTLYEKGQMEIVLVNSGSSQNEDAVIREYESKYPAIRYIRTDERETIYQAWNRGIKAASGKYITNANTDDRHRKDGLEIMANALDQNPGVALVYGDIFVTNYENQTFENFINCGYQIKPGYKKEIMLTGCHMGPQPMWRKSLHRELGYFSEELKSAGDYEFWCRIATKYDMLHIAEFLGLYLENSSGIVNENIKQSVVEANVVKRFYAAQLPSAKESFTNNYQFRHDSHNTGFVNICMITYNRLGYTKKSIESVLKYTSYPHVITVVDNGSEDGTREYLKGLKQRGIIKNLILLENNVGVARASNLAWLREPDAEYYLKLDNDIVLQKPGWLADMVTVAGSIPEAGAVAYNFEPVSYPIENINGMNIRTKRGILGGACILIPRKTNKLLGYWCEDYGLYGEEDADYGFRVSVSGLLNIYMADENAGFHLPSGKAAAINPETYRAVDVKEEIEYGQYRKWKDEQRIRNVKGGKLSFSLQGYANGKKPLYVKPEFATGYLKEHESDKALGKPIGLRNAGLSIIIPVYNKARFTEKCLESIYKNTDVKLNYEVIVVDNASSDETPLLLAGYESKHGNFSLLKQESNLGFSRANNLAAKSARGEYLVFLNNDTEVKKGWLEPLLEMLEKDPSLSAAGSKLLYPDGRIQHAGVGIFNDKKVRDPLLAQHLYLNEPSDYKEAGVVKTYQALTAACLMVRRSAFEEVGGFDEEYWNGYEDVDLCFKMREKGYKLAYQPKSVVIHHESQSGGERFSRVKENISRLHEKWLGKVKPDFIVEEDGRTYASGEELIREYLPPEENAAASEVKEHKVEEHKVEKHKVEKRAERFVSIIILTFNGFEFNKECISSILKHTKQKYELIVVDNASSDATVGYLEKLQKEHKNIKVIFNGTNLGFPAAINQALKAASGNYVLIANNDIVVTEGWLKRMLEVAESDARTGIVGPISNLVSGIQMDKDAKYKTIPEMHSYAKKVRKQNAGETLEYLRVSFLCTLIKKEVIDIIGGLDERFSPGNFEDDDFCLRSHIAGYRTVVAKDVFIHHYGSKSFRADGYEKYAQLIRLNEKKFLDKWGASIDEIWLEKKNVIERSICFPIHRDEFMESYKRALVHFFDGEYELAERALKRLIEIYEKKASAGVLDEYGNALNLYGNICLKKKDLKKARGYFERELELKPASVSGSLGLGEVFFASGNYKEAREMFLIALEKDPKDSSAIAGLAKANGRLGLNGDREVKVSAIVSVYNCEKFIRGCLEDLVAQTLYKKGELEIVIVNTGSVQNEDKVIREFKSKYYNINYIKVDERETIYQAWNRGIKAAKGKYITNANTDDRHRKDALEVLSGLLDQNEEFDLVYSDLYVTEKENENFEAATISGKLKRPAYAPEHLLIACLMGPQPMWRKRVHEKAGYFDESLKSASDYEFWCRMAFLNNSKMLHVPEFLGLYYYNEQGIELGNRPLSEKESNIIRDKYKMLLNEKKLQNENSSNAASENNTAGKEGSKREIEMAESLIESERLNEAMDILMRVIKADSQNIDAMNDLAVISIMAGDFEPAADFIERVIKIDPMNDVALENMNYLSELIDQKINESKNSSESYFQKAASDEEAEVREPVKGQYGGLIEKAETFIESNDLSSARKVLEAVLLMEGENIDALNDLSVVEILEKNYSKAAELLERVISKDPLNEVATENVLALQRELDNL